MLLDQIDRYEAATLAAFENHPDTQLAQDVAVYIAHVAKGAPMRAIATARGSAPSTISHAVRWVEMLRDDPLVDRTLTSIEATIDADPSLSPPIPPAPREKEISLSRLNHALKMTKADKALMRRLCEPEAFLLVAHNAEKARVFCRTNQFCRPLAMVAIDKAVSYLKREWIKCVSRTHISARYEVTTVGRSALRRVLAADETADDTGYSETPSPFSSQHQSRGERRVVNMTTGEVETIKVNLGESPLGWLSRRKDATGQPLLEAEEVEAGKRLHEDFELAQIGPKVAQD